MGQIKSYSRFAVYIAAGDGLCIEHKITQKMMVLLLYLTAIIHETAQMTIYISIKRHLKKVSYLT